MNQTEQYQYLLDDSYNIISKIDQSFKCIIQNSYSDELCADSIKKIDKHYNAVIQKPAKLVCDQIFHGEFADEIASNYLYAAVYLYFIYQVIDEKFNRYSEQVNSLKRYITEFIAQIPLASKDNFLGYHEKDTDETEFEFILGELINEHSNNLNIRSNYEMEQYCTFRILANYCKYINNKFKLYKRVNDAILSNNNPSHWIDTLKISAYVHMLRKGEEGLLLDRNVKNKLQAYNLETAVIHLATQHLACKSSIDVSFRIFRNEADQHFTTLLHTHNRILRSFPSISFLLYKSISKMTYHKCKSYFIETINPPKPFDDNDKKFQVYSTQELEKYSFTDFKGLWAQIRIQKMMFFALSNFADEATIKSVLEKGTWYQPETQKNILNNALSSKNIPEIEKSFDFSEFNNEGFSATETALNMLYNLARFNDSKSSLDIIQQINFIDEQRSKLFLYQDIKPTDRPLDKDKPKNNAEKPRWFNQFCPASRDNLKTEIRTMAKIDCGFPLPVQVQLFPTYNKKIFARKQNCKLFLETDTACDLPHDIFYRNRYKNMLQTRYIYPARNMATHYSKYTPTESLLEEKNFDDLTNFLYDTKSRLEKEQELRNLKDELKYHRLVQSAYAHAWPCLKNNFNTLIEKLSTAIKSSDYTGKMKEADIKKIGVLETSREILDILYEIQENYKKEDDFSEKLAETIQHFEKHHPDIYCLLKDIISQKEYVGSLNNQQLNKMNESLSPLTRCDNMYYTLSDIRKDYSIGNDLAKELDLYIADYKRYAIVVPKEDTKLLIKLFQQTESFFIQHKETLIKTVNEAFKNKDYEKANQSRSFLQEYINFTKDIKEDLRAVFWKIGHSFYDKTAAFSETEKEIILDVLNKVFISINNLPLSKHIKNDIAAYDAKKIYESIFLILSVQRYFVQATGLNLSDIHDQIRDFIPLYTIRIILKTADKIKDILTSSDFNSTNDLDIFDSNKMQKLIDQRYFDKFIAMQTKMEQSIDQNILFYYSKDHEHNVDLFHDKKKKEEHLKSVYQSKICDLKKLIKEQSVDKLTRALKYIERLELPTIQFENPNPKYYNDYLKFIEKINKECIDIRNDEIQLLAKKIHEGIYAKKKEAALKYDKNSFKIFKEDETYSSFLIKQAKDLLLETIKCCTSSIKVQNELRKNEQIFINKKGMLGLNKNDELSDDIHYTEDFKGRVGQFLNSIFGISNICLATEKKDLDSIHYSDIKEIDVSFFDQYNKLILLYLVRVSVELAHVKKIKI